MIKEAKKLINITDSKKEPSKEFMKRKPSVIFKNNLRIKRQFEKMIWKRKKQGIRGLLEVIIRDLARIDSYPNIEEHPRGISPWFKVEIKGLYYRGLEVFIGPPEYVIFDEKKAGVGIRERQRKE